MIPSLGRTVHYVLPREHKHKGQHRAARITQVWTDKQGEVPTEATDVCLSVDLDPVNDEYSGSPVLVVRRSSQDPHGKMEGSWHEPERVDTPAMAAERAKMSRRGAAEPVPA
jgi:hypothetical protein